MATVDDRLPGRTLILLSNREPYEHATAADGGAPTVKRPAGGLVSALDPTMRATHGTWVAWGSGSADRAVADAEGRVAVPPEAPEYTLRRVWLDEADVEGYYLGFANSALWPLCHLLVQHYHFRAEYWTRYEAVNARFADAVADEARRARHAPVIWVQDYHFALAAAQVRERLAADPGAHGDRAFLHQFWHIPFPPPDMLNLLPRAVQEGVIRGMLGNDLLEFHTERHAMNFMDCAAAVLGDEVEMRREEHRMRVGGRDVYVGAFPISIDVARYEAMADAAAEKARALRERWARPACTLAVSVDRVDYTKGIPERLRAIDHLYEIAPRMRGCLTFLVVATPSRSELASYADLEHEVREAVQALNDRWGTEDWQPIELILDNVPAEELAAIYRAGDVCLVSSLQDGMNLVAKEFIACNVEEQGVLVLSRFTGAAEELEGAVLVNPFHLDGFTEGLCSAIEMPLDQRRARMHAMREQLRQATIFDWMDAIFARVRALAPSVEAAV